MNKAESKYFNTAVKFNNALLSLLEKKPFEYITISEICEEAGVNRSTFYLHYENTCDLLDETLRYVLNTFVSYFSADDQVAISRYRDCDVAELNFISEKYLQPYLTFIRENKRVFLAVLSQPVTFKFESIFERLFDNIFNPILDRFHYPEDERQYVMRFYLNGLMAIITEWLHGGCEKSMEEVAEIIRYCIFGREDKWSMTPPRG
jgi:AcrR family transcriptional regulator